MATNPDEPSGERPLTTDPHQRLALRPGLVHRAVGDEVFVLMADSTVHWLKNATATALWRTLVAAGVEGCSVAALAEALVADFDVEPARALEDASEFATTLVARGVLAPVGGAPPAPVAPD